MFFRSWLFQYWMKLTVWGDISSVPYETGQISDAILLYDPPYIFSPIKLPCLIGNQSVHCLSDSLYSMKIKKQTRKLAAGCSKHGFEVMDRTDEVSSRHSFEVANKTDEVSSKHGFEVVDRTDEVSYLYLLYTARRRWRGLKRFSKSIKWLKQ